MLQLLRAKHPTGTTVSLRWNCLVIASRQLTHALHRLLLAGLGAGCGFGVGWGFGGGNIGFLGMGAGAIARRFVTLGHTATDS